MPRPERSLDDMPLAAYGGSGMEDDGDAVPDAAPDAVSAAQPPRGPTGPAPASVPASDSAPAPGSVAPPPDDLPVPEDEPSNGPSLVSRVIHLFRTSRIAAGAGFAVVIIVGLVLLSSGGGSPGATAATPTKGPTAAPVVVAPSGEASVVLSGAVAGTFPLTGLAGGQHVDATSVTLGWGDTLQTTLSIAGPLDRGTRTTDERLILTLAVVVNGQPVTFTSSAGECTVGMAQVGGKVQGSFTCHALKSADGKLKVDASGNYRS